MRREIVAAVTAIFLLLPACSRKPAAAKPEPTLQAYTMLPDTNDPQHPIPLDYLQAQGARVFQAECVWCHADATPAGPSNRSNVTPTPPLFSDGATLNPLNDQFLQNIVTLGGSAMGKSAMMPPWGRTLTADEIRAVIAYIRVIVQPPYQPPARSRGEDSKRQ